VTASARLLDVVMRTAGIVVGIVASLELAWRLGAPLSSRPIPLRSAHSEPSSLAPR
jgi:hypothetical protein